MRLKLVVLLSASLLFPLFGCGGGDGTIEVDPGFQQLLEQINAYRAGESLWPWIYDPAVAAVAQAYAEWLDSQTPLHQFPYSEDADGIGLSGRLSDARILVTASAEVGCSSVSTINAQLFFDNYVLPSGILLRTDIDRMGVGHVSPPFGGAYNHYWVLDAIKRAPPIVGSSEPRW